MPFEHNSELSDTAATVTQETASSDEDAVTNHGAPGPNVSVVMVSYRTGPILFSAIESVLSPDQVGVAELILIDNGNPPEVTAELARRAERDPRLRIVSGHGNVGFARGCNLGAGEARGHHLLLLNPDCRLARGAIPALLAEAAGLGEDWMLGCRVRNPDGTDQRGSRRERLTPVTALVEVLRLDRLSPRLFRHHRLNHHLDPLPARTAPVPAISGACMMLPAATYRAVGAMDEGYFLHVEDLDLFLRLDRAGTPIHFAPHVDATHHAGSSRVNPLFVEWHKARGFLRYFRLHFRDPRWLPLLGPLAAGLLVRCVFRFIGALASLAWRPFAPRAAQAPERTRPDYP